MLRFKVCSLVDWTAKSRCWSVCGFVLGFFLSGASHAAVMSLNSTLQVVATAGINAAEVVDTASDSQGPTINDLGLITASATSTTLTTSGSAHASWVSTSQGQVSFLDLGWDNGPFPTTSQSSLDGTQWTYTFLADVTGLFTLDWSIVLDPANNTDFGLNRFFFSLVGHANTGFNEVLAAGASGISTRNIHAGHIYTVTIKTDVGVFGGVGGRDSHMDGFFNWQMDSGPALTGEAPTPVTLLLFLKGLMILCIVKVRRH